MARILIVDAYEPMRTALANVLEQYSHEVTVVASSASALILVTQNKPDVVLLELSMPDSARAVQVLTRCRMNGIKVVVMVDDTSAAVSSLAQAKRLGAVAQLIKPFPVDALVACVHQVLDTPSDSMS